MKARVYVDWDGVLTELYPGATVVGRDFDCRIRSNDAMVSRHHLRFLVGDDGTVYIEDLESTNGTRVNGETVQQRQELKHADEIEIGTRKFKLRIEAADSREAASAPTQETIEAEVKPKGLATHVCPRCKTPMRKTQGMCANCRYRPPFARPTATTAELKQVKPNEDRRDESRRAIYVPVVYASENLTFDGVARDLSKGGVFVETEFLEPVGTNCQITALPEGAPPVTFAGRVAHVVESAGEATKCGLGVQFTRIGPEAEAWMTRMLEASTRGQ